MTQSAEQSTADMACEFMLRLERVAEPFQCLVAVRLTHPFAPALYEPAARHLLKLMPRLGDYPVMNGDSVQWLAVEGGTEAVVRQVLQVTPASAAALYPLPVDFSKSPQWRLTPSTDGELIIHWHHALGDGLSGVAFTRRVLETLLALEADKPLPDWAGEDSGEPVRLPPKWYRALDLVRIAATNVWHAKYDPPVTLGPPEVRKGPGRDYLLTTLPGKTVLNLRERAKKVAPEASLNDALVTALHLALGEMHDAHVAAQKPRGGERRVAVGLPVDLHRGKPRPERFVNEVVEARLHSWPEDRASPVRLLKTLSAQRKKVLSRRPWFFVKALSALGRRTVDKPSPWQYFVTATFSNMGAVDFPERFGARVTAVFAVPPTFPPAAVTLSCIKVGDAFCIGQASSQGMINAADAGELVRRFTHHVETLFA